ncbi:MAG: DUF3604 domain-containing protein [Gammaproteobacteria bacterium]|nr:DUF3604 domain-containing protein [Gammaproteobacteria bacterium]
MNTGTLNCALSFLILVLALATPCWAEQPPAKTISAYANKNLPMNVYWGDTHLHSYLSLDAGTAGPAAGGIEMTPEIGYRFARGEAIEMRLGGMVAQLHRPLDFLVVSDHAEYLGVASKIRQGEPALLATPGGKRWYQATQVKAVDGERSAIIIGAAAFLGINLLDPALAEPYVRSAWDYSVDMADKYNDPGNFTAMIGFEWSSAPQGNLHRNVLYRDGADKAGIRVPFSALDSLNPEDLWAYMAEYEESTGGQILSIPHNSNLSSGKFFARTDDRGSAIVDGIDSDYATLRARWEPLVEVTQTKGDSETHSFLSPDDEFADFERWDQDTMKGKHQDSYYQYEYARSALKRGLQLEQDIGTNPFKFGMIGSTDSHGLPVAEEDNFWGVAADNLPGSEARSSGPFFRKDGITFTRNVDLGASGYAAVWATENTREALFDAMKRKEVYATTGARMTVRFFGGWNYLESDAHSPHVALIGYEKGVPMGADLPASSKAGAAPHFLVFAGKDPDGANLDRIQIVKGWVDKAGDSHERVFNVALSDGRKPGRGGKVKPVGNTVDVKTATYYNTIGEAQLGTVWTDPEFDPGQRAFYYARVIEIPTPRWTTYEVARFGVTIPEDVPLTLQERAYTSPIWYTP